MILPVQLITTVILHEQYNLWSDCSAKFNSAYYVGKMKKDIEQHFPVQFALIIMYVHMKVSTLFQLCSLLELFTS